MTGALAAYLRRRVAVCTLTLTALLVALMQVLELMDITTDVLDRGLGLEGLAYYALLRVPSEVVLALPLAALLGAMWAFHDLARSHEMIAIRTAGVSLRQILAYLLPVPLVVAAIYTGLSQGLEPEAEATLQAWWSATAPPEDKPDPTWIRTSAGPVSYMAASPDGRKLSDVRIYRRGENTLLSERIWARSAEWERGVWRLQGVEQLHVPADGGLHAANAKLTWETNLSPDDVRRAEIARPHLSGLMLIDVLDGQRAASQPLSFYQTALYRTLVSPLTPFIMLLLALPTLRSLPRRDDGGAALLAALTLGLGFLLCDGVMAALGTSGRVPAIAAALAAPVLFAAIGLLQLRRNDVR